MVGERDWDGVVVMGIRIRLGELRMGNWNGMGGG